jgi:putative transposase
LKQSRFTEAQIVDILAQAARGDMTARDVCNVHGITEQTFYRWKKKYGDMGTSDVKRLRELESENARLKRMLAESALELDAIKDVLRGK